MKAGSQHFLTLLLLLFFSECSATERLLDDSSSTTPPYYSTYASSIRPKYYNLSALSSDDDSTLQAWIDFKNGIPRFTLYLEWLEYNSFRPENSQYREGIGMVGIYYLIFFDFCILLSSLLLFFKIFFSRDYDTDKSRNPRSAHNAEEMVVPLVLLALSALVFYVGAVITSYGNIEIYLGVRQTSDVMESEATQVQTNVDNVYAGLNEVAANWALLKTDYVLDLDPTYFKSNMSAYAADIASTSTSNAAWAMGFEIGRFSWVWIQLVLNLVIVILALVGYMPCQFAGIVVAGSIIIFTLFAEISLLLAYSSSEILVIADICEQVYKLSKEDRVPYRETGIGYYLTPISPENTGVTLLYLEKAARAYDLAIQSFTQSVRLVNPSERQANSTSDVDTMLQNPAYSYELWVKQTGRVVKLLDSVIQSLYDLKNNRHLREFIYESQNELCMESLAKSTYAYFGLLMITVSTICVVVVCVHLVKLRKMPKFKALAKLVGVYRRIAKGAKKD